MASPALSRSPSVSSSNGAPPLFEGIAPPRPPTTNGVEETLIPVEGLAGRGVRLRVDAKPGCGGVAWPAGEVLSRYLAYRHSIDPGMLAGKTIVELGSGTGLVGIVAAVLEETADVWITDQMVLLPLMKANAHLNLPSSSNLHVAELNWGEPFPPELPSPDLVLAADCVYFEPAFPLLVSTLCELAPVNSGVEVLFCWKKRRKADKRFFAMLKKHFESEQVNDDRPGESQRYTRDGVTLLRLRRRR